MSASTTVPGESPSCGYSGGEDIAEDLKKIAKAMNHKGKLRIARSGCMDLCAFGPEYDDLAGRTNRPNLHEIGRSR
jgi:NADH:ubiquinone oxidoreductase subunit E